MIRIYKNGNYLASVESPLVACNLVGTKMDIKRELLKNGYLSFGERVEMFYDRNKAHQFDENLILFCQLARTTEGADEIVNDAINRLNRLKRELRKNNL